MHSPMCMHLHKMYYARLLNGQLVGNFWCAIYINSPVILVPVWFYVRSDS